MMRSLEFQVGALLELTDAHKSYDLTDHDVTEVINRKRDLVMETFQTVREALWWQQRKQRQALRRQRDADTSPPWPSGQSTELESSGLRELEALKLQLTQRVAQVIEPAAPAPQERPLQQDAAAPAMAPLVLTSTVFHYRSPT